MRTLLRQIKQKHGMEPHGQLQGTLILVAILWLVLELKRRHPKFLSNTTFLSRFDQFLDGGVPDCRAGEAFFNIDSTGDIAICVEERSRPVANLYRDSARRIVEALRRRASTNTCTDCWYNCRGEVESLYRPGGVIRSLPTLLCDRGRAPRKSAATA